MSRIIRFGISLGLIGFVIAQFGTDVLQRLSHLRYEWLFLALLLSVAQVVLSAWRWRYTAHQLGLELKRGTALREYYLGTLVNQVLPGGVLGDAQRAWRHGQSLTQRSPAFQAVIIERFSGQLAMVLIALGAWLIAPWRPALPPAFVLGLATIGLISTGFLSVTSLKRWAPNWWQALEQGLLQWRVLPLQMGASVLVATSYIGVFACCLMASAAMGSPVIWLGLIPLVLFAMLIPLSLGGWGLREGAAAVLWPLAGLAAAEGVTAAILYGGLSLIASLPGVIALIRR
ncbi:MAG: lysylphosphatidylglycerol synthase transmembrane domain-containing protein [Spiribacter sp.]|jgi:uncharacterized membrane protein YbhN (UPF0104 family)|nr:lysylphosphatidylglycerol synthase transmembrane domain-containing protein [Spiribacter sp.]MDR9488929.1 lysylphosphatidylglycerol synthase transmembrane domain-containing protein [Spiribacter sp.]